ncbi:MAG: T9SS type A sorting domain-containing protein [Rhodothermales bacterium]
MRILLATLALLLLAGQPATGQGTVTVANGGLRLQAGGQLATSAHLILTGTFDGNGTFLFDGTGNQKLTPAINLTLNNLTVDKSAGDLILQGDIAVAGTLTLTSGDLDLNGFSIDLGERGILAETSGNTVKGTSGVITASTDLNAPAGVNVGGLGAEISSGENLGSTTVTRGHTIQVSGASISINRYFDISPTNNTRLDARLVFHYDASELNGLDESTLILFRSPDGGANWTEEGGTVDRLLQTITLTGIDSFSRWTAASNDTPLPVELTAFSALLDQSDVVLHWATASETNNAGFEVEQKTEPGAWAGVGFVEGHGTTLEPQTYSYRVAGMEPGHHRFRLKQIDFDGSFEYSPEVEVYVEVPGAYVLVAPYPNPFNPEAQFSLTVAQAQHARVAVYDVLGRRVAVLHQGPFDAARVYRFRFDGSGLPSGVYVLQATGERFAASRTMTLLK